MYSASSSPYEALLIYTYLLLFRQSKLEKNVVCIAHMYDSDKLLVTPTVSLYVQATIVSEQCIDI